MKLVRKATAPGELDADKGIRFVLSTDEPDLMGDVVVQQGLSLSRNPLPAQIDHGGGLFSLIGQWTNVKFGAHQTTATLKLLARGISKAADLVRDLYEAGIQLAASIGFVPADGKYELIRDPKNDRVIGIRWLEAQLTEASIVVTPANPSALALAKSLFPIADISGRSSDEDARPDVLSQLRGTGVPATVARPTKKGQAMNLAEQIRAVQKALDVRRDRALAISEELANATDETRGALVAELDEVNKAVETGERELEVLKRTEATISARARPVEPSAPAILTHQGPVVPEKKKIDLLVRSALCTFEAYLKRVPLAQIIDERYGRDPMLEATKAVAQLTQTKAAQNPAMTSVPEWAGALVRDGYGAFMEALAPESVIPRLGLADESFDGFQSITIPMRNQSPNSNPNLAAAFRAEGAPIRVGSVQLTSKKLTPKSMGIIGTFTMELFKRSTPNIETKIRDWMIEDTAIALDYIFLGTDPGSATQPPGIANALGANTAPSTGNSAAQITADLRGRLQQMAATGNGRKPVWVMNPARKWGLALTLTAAGTPLFPELANGQLLGYPVVTSITVDPTVVYLIDAAAVTFAGGSPEFLGTEVATIHEEYDATAVSPISGAGTPNTVAAPVRSLYQTYSAALRALWEVDWAVLRSGAVQTITGVNW